MSAMSYNDDDHCYLAVAMTIVSLHLPCCLVKLFFVGCWMQAIKKKIVAIIEIWLYSLDVCKYVYSFLLKFLEDE